jgi:molybdate transport system substrate-binding protein
MRNPLSRTINRLALTAFICLAGSALLVAGDIHWYLAASLAKPAKEIVSQFNRQGQACEVFPIVGGSGQLLSKISMAKIGDLYSPASTEFFDKTKSLGLVADFKVLLLQTPVFGLSTAGKNKISSFQDLTARSVRIALGNPKTMALANSYLKIEQKMGPALTRELRRNSIVEAINVNQIVSYVLLGVVDAGLIFDTVARANDIPYVDIPEEYNVETKAYLIRLTTSPNENKACLNKFDDYIYTRDDIFSKYGFQLRVGSKN